MSTRPSILVATDQVTDAVLIKKLLQDEFGNIQMTSDPDQSVADFERCRPAVLILAFHSLEKAERYYLGLYRLSTLVHALPHRTLILCSKDDLRRVYELCKKDHFDDYILFWPMAQDALRLPMAVHHALQHAAGSAGDMPTSAEFAAQARRIAGLEAMLEQGLNHGGVRIKAASGPLVPSNGLQWPKNRGGSSTTGKLGQIGPKWRSSEPDGANLGQSCPKQPMQVSAARKMGRCGPIHAEALADRKNRYLAGARPRL